jgi:hypothetical protein
MSVYMVTYDLNAPGQDYGSLIREIEKYIHCKALKSAYFVDSSLSAPAIRDHLKKHIDGTDVLFVMELQKHWAVNRATTASSWLKSESRTWS